MATPIRTVVRPAKAPKTLVPNAACGTLLVLAGLLLLPIAVLHPEGNDAATVSATPGWTMVHVAGSVGFGAVALVALVRLATTGVPGRAAAVGAAGVVVFGTVLAGGLAVDGFVSPALADIDGDAGSQPVRTVALAFEEALVSLGFGGFGLAAALVTIANNWRAGIGWRIGAVLAAIAFVALAAAGALYLGAGLDLGFLFASMLLIAPWFIAIGVREVVAARRTAAAPAAGRPAGR